MKFVAQTLIIGAPAWSLSYCTNVAGKHFIQLEGLMKTHVEKDLDKDWHRLIQEARTMGLRIDDVRQFLESEKVVKKNSALHTYIRHD